MTEDTQALATTEQQGTELAGYGNREDIKEMTRRIRMMVPNANKMDDAGVFALAQVSVALSLNPITGEVWAIPQKGGTWAIMAGIKGLRKAARVAVEKRDKNGTYYIDHRLPTEDELDGVTINAGDFARACDCYVLTQATIAMAQITGKPIMFTGLGIFRANERTKMEHVMVARKRAEADALKQAFDLSALTGYQPEPPTEWELADRARDNALPYEHPSRGRNELYKVSDRSDPRPQPDNDVVEGEVVSSESQSQAWIEEQYGFYDDVLAGVMDPTTGKPYFHNTAHVVLLLDELQAYFVPGEEKVLLELIEGHVDKQAHAHANAEAAAEGQQGLAL